MKMFAMVLTSALLLGSFAHAGEIADRVKWEKLDKKNKDAIDRMADADHCGSTAKLTVTWDKASFNSDEALEAGKICSYGIIGIGDFCHQHKASQGDIAKGIQSITCHYDASLDSKSPAYGNKFAKKGTAIDFAFKKDAANVDRLMKEFLEKQM